MTPTPAGALRDRLASLGIEVVCLAGYTDFCMAADRPDIPAREMQILHVRELCRLAHDLDCRLVRVFTGFDHPAASFDQQWNGCVAALRECAVWPLPWASRSACRIITTWPGTGASMLDLLADVNEPNCKAMFDAWTPALQGDDLAEAARALAPHMVHTTVADYVRRPRFRYQPPLVNFTREPDAIRAVPMGEGFIDYRAFLRTLRDHGYQGHVAYEMCSPLRGGGSEENLDRCARRFLEFMAAPSLDCARSFAVRALTRFVVGNLRGQQSGSL